jgi:hypothetical protein
MTHVFSPPFHKSALTGLFILFTFATTVYGQERVQHVNDPCADAASGRSGAHARSETGSGKRSEAASSCVGANCTTSSAASTRHDGLSGSSTLPDGSSVTVHAGNGVVSSSSANSDSSGSTNGSAAASGRGTDCPPRNDAQAKDPESTWHNEMKRNSDE